MLKAVFWVSHPLKSRSNFLMKSCFMQENRHTDLSSSCFNVFRKLLEFSGSHDAAFNYIYLQLVLIKPGAPYADTLAVNVTGTSGLKQSAGRVGWWWDPTGSSDIGVRRTQCDSGWNMTLGTHRGMEAVRRRAQLGAKERCTNDYWWLCRIWATLLSVCPSVCGVNLPRRPEAHLYSWGYISLGHTQAHTEIHTCLNKTVHTHSKCFNIHALLKSRWNGILRVFSFCIVTYFPINWNGTGRWDTTPGGISFKHWNVCYVIKNGKRTMLLLANYLKNLSFVLLKVEDWLMGGCHNIIGWKLLVQAYESTHHI